MLDTLKGLMDGLGDLESLLPDLNAMFDHLAGLMRIAVLAAPVALVVLGLVYLFLAPKEANHSIGFRCWWGMSSVEVWQFTQKMAGITWTVMGVVLGLIALFTSNGYASMESAAMMMNALRLLGWQLALVLISIVAFNLVLLVLFDRKGVNRFEKK